MGKSSKAPALSLWTIYNIIVGALLECYASSRPPEPSFLVALTFNHVDVADGFSVAL